jgi:hypothetical protein
LPPRPSPHATLSCAALPFSALPIAAIPHWAAPSPAHRCGILRRTPIYARPSRPRRDHATRRMSLLAGTTSPAIGRRHYDKKKRMLQAYVWNILDISKICYKCFMRMLRK